MQEIKASNGIYAIDLPGATNRNPFPGQIINPLYGIGGQPRILIETDYRGDPPTPPATATPMQTPDPGNPSTSFAPAIFKDYPLGISGQIIDQAGLGLGGVTIKSDMGKTASSDPSGFYAFNHLDPGTYILRPEKDGYTFQPQSRQVTLPPSVSQQNFVAYPPTPTPEPYPDPESG